MEVLSWPFLSRAPPHVRRILKIWSQILEINGSVFWVPFPNRSSAPAGRCRGVHPTCCLQRETVPVAPYQAKGALAH